MKALPRAVVALVSVLAIAALLIGCTARVRPSWTPGASAQPSAGSGAASSAQPSGTPGSQLDADSVIPVLTPKADFETCAERRGEHVIRTERSAGGDA